MRRRLILLCLVCSLAGCGSTGLAATPPTATPAAHSVLHHTRPRPRSHVAASPSGLPYSTASAHRVQPQPAPGACHATGQAPYVLPDRHCTPGALNPAVTQARISRTICVPGYTKTIRPSESITAREKLASMAAYGLGGQSAHDFEYDHLVSLELGGAANDPRNLWPEPGGSPNPKDSVEDELHRLVCDGQMRLARAQHIIATNWVSFAKAHRPGPGPRPGGTRSGPNKPISEVNCSDFRTHAAAQRWFTAHGGSASNDVAGLDGDHDGIACESLP